MKKLAIVFIILSFLLSCCGANVLASSITQDSATKQGSTDLSLSIDSTYTITIPASVSINEQTLTGSGTISASAGLRIASNQQLAVTLTTCDFTLSTNDKANLSYTITNDAGAVALNDVVCSFVASETKVDKTITFTANTPVYSGDYSDTVTFTIGIV